MKTEFAPHLDRRDEEAKLHDESGNALGDVMARIWPRLSCGSFWLSNEDEFKRIKEGRTTLRTATGLHVILVNVRQCPGTHIPSRDGIHVEFDFQALGSATAVA